MPDPRLVNRSLHRNTRRSNEGEAAFAILSAPVPLRETAKNVNADEERVATLHGRVLDLAPRLRDLCWAIDAANAEPEEPQPAVS